MGGHALSRTDRAFAEVAALGRTLARAGYFVASGGGPGAMEASNLGAYLAPHPDDALTGAIDVLREAPGYRDAGYLAAAYAVRERYPEGAESLAIPTWFYGHEPTNLFATHVAKFFANSLREDGLLAIAHHGVIYAPGSAGTVQEIFMDAAQNHYVTFKTVSPMAFLGARYWTETLPVWPLIQALSEGRAYQGALLLSDDVDEIAAFVRANPPFVPPPQ
jgi:predicted Rossmann-fold nucleotide-binding protein